MAVQSGGNSRWCDATPDHLRQRSMSMEDSQSEVVPREFLVCPLCRDEYQEPKYLPCLHSFCKACIDEHIESTSDRQAGNFLCPVCATPTEVPQAEGGTDSVGPALPDNTFAWRLSCPAYIQGHREKKCSQCQVNDAQATEANTHCINCDEFLCADCSLKHLDQKETASHKIQKIEHFEEGETTGGNIPSITPATAQEALPRCCQFYDPLDIGALFCVDCEMTLCAECHARDHSDHRCAEIAAIAQNFENKIKDPLRELRKDNRTLQKSLMALSAARKQAAKRQEELKQSVRRRTQLLCDLIRDYESILLIEVDKRHGDNLAAIQEREDAMKRHVSSIKAVTDLTEKLLVFGSDEEKVAMRRKIGRRVRELCEEDLPSKRPQLNKVSLTEPAVAVENICEMFGELQTSVDARGSKEKSKTQRSPMVQSNSIDLGMMSRVAGIHKQNSISPGGEGVVTAVGGGSVSSRNILRHSASAAEAPPPPSLTELEEFEEEDEYEDMDMLSASNTSETLRSASKLLLAHKEAGCEVPTRNISSTSLSQSNGSDAARSGGSSLLSHSNGSENLHRVHFSMTPKRSHSNSSGSGVDDLRRMTQDNMLPPSPRPQEVPNSSVMTSSHADTSFHSCGSHGTEEEEAPCINLGSPLREMLFPAVVARDCIKGIGVTPQGDIVVGTVSPGGNGNVFILEEHGIVRGHIEVERGWSIHSITADGKVSMLVVRNDNRYKVKVVSGEGGGQVIVDAHIESFGLSFFTATRTGTLLVTATRYATPNTVLGRSAKAGGNVTLYDRSGVELRRLTNDTFSPLGYPYLLDRPALVTTDHKGNFFVADPGRHSVIGFHSDGELMFEYGNTDVEEELYQGPDALCVDKLGHVVVLDRKDGRIDVLSYEGQLLRCYFPPEHVRFVCVTPQRMLMLVNSEGEMKFYDYMDV